MAVTVKVAGKKIEDAMRELKGKLQRELVFRKIKNGRFHTPKSVEKAIRIQNTKRRIKKNNRRRRLEG